MPARARPEPAYFSLTDLRMNLAAIGVNLKTDDLSHFPCRRLLQILILMLFC
jgi:hypothetical protein